MTEGADKVPLLCAGYAMETKSSIIAIGLSVHHTPVEIREKLSIPQVWFGSLSFSFNLLALVLDGLASWALFALCSRLVLKWQGDSSCRLNGLVPLRS